MFSLLFILPVLSVAAHTGMARHPLNARQATTVNCGTQCTALSTALSPGQTGGLAAICTNDVLNNYNSCYSCQVGAGQISQPAAQSVVDSFTEGCKNAGHPVNSVTISTTGGGSAGGSSPAASGAAPASSGASTPAAGKTSGGARLTAGSLAATSAVVALWFASW